LLCEAERIGSAGETMKLLKPCTLALVGAGMLSVPVFAATAPEHTMSGMKGMKMGGDMKSAAVATPSVKRELPAVPKNLPAWLYSRKNNEIFYKRGPYNFAIYDIPKLAYDMNGVAVGHSMAYEALVTGKADQLETTIWNRINAVLKNPPKLMPDEKFISPTFGRKYGVLELVFDWTHVSHAQTIDAYVSTKLTNADKDRETARLWDYYLTQGKPFLITSLPMNMEWLDSQPYSGAFRQKYPKVNALFWGYHWLQTSVYDGLRSSSQAEQSKAYELLGQRYHEVELYNTKRPFMPMMAETSPKFSAEFPQIANAFDNLHMLHDMVNDILASERISQQEKDAQIRRAIWIMSADAHKDCKPGENKGVIDGVSHDHRFMAGMPGMGMMKGGTTELMWMPKMGWMNMSQCHHCSMPLVDDGAGEKAWMASTVSAEGWTMRVRCALCARDMSAEAKGGAILKLATEDPQRVVTVFSDEAGNLTTTTPDVVFIEEKAGHPKCHQWSRAFTNRAVFEAYVKANPKFKDAKMLTFKQWAEQEAEGTPDTYVKEKGPVENPYAAELKARGLNPEESEKE
jgi:hypothetical protein